MKLNRLIRLYLLILATIALLLVSKALKAEWWPTRYDAFNLIRSKAKALPRGTYVRFTANSGEVTYGYLLSYEYSEDYIWYQPVGTQSWFSQDAFDVRELASFEVAEPI